MRENEVKIYNALVMLSVALGQTQDTNRLKIYVANLKNFPISDVLKQIESFTRTARFFPQLVEIIEPLKGLDRPTNEMAVIIAEEILEAARSFSSIDTEEARKYLGEEKWGIANRIGWQTLTMLEYDELPTMRAQIRELAKAYIEKSKRETREETSIGFNINTNLIDIKSGKKKELVRLDNIL